MSLVALLPLLALGCFDSEPAAETTTTPAPVAPVPAAQAAAPSGVTPIYVTVGAHLENKLPLPCGDSGCAGHCKDAYLQFRDNIIQYARLMDRYGAAYNVQTNYHLPQLEDACVDDATRQATTNGKHLLVYLMDDLGAMIDPHAHENQTERYETRNNYADVYQLLADAGVPADSMSVVGGCIVGSDYQWGQFADGYEGNAFASTRWTPAAFTFPAVHDHDPDGEDFTSGIWRPTAFEWEPASGRMGDGYYEHDPNGAYAMIGSGYLHSCAGRYPRGSFWWASDYVTVLAGYLEDGRAPSGRMYTATIAMNQKHFADPDSWMGFLEHQLEALQPLVQSGKVVYAHYQELPGIWQSQYGGEPNLFRWDQFDPADFTCDGKGNAIGAAAGQPRLDNAGGGKGAKQRPAGQQRPQGQRPPKGQRGGGGKKGGGAKR